MARSTLQFNQKGSQLESFTIREAYVKYHKPERTL